jgi:hypothetical protein
MKDGKALPQFFFSPTMVAQIENGWWQEEQRWSAIARLFVKDGRVTRLDLLPITMDIQKDGLPSFADDALSRRILPPAFTSDPDRQGIANPRPAFTKASTASWVSRM